MSKILYMLQEQDIDNCPVQNMNILNIMHVKNICHEYNKI
jgi:hypothetical protein